MSGLNCVESCLDCHLRKNGFFCNLSRDLIEDFDKIKHAPCFPSMRWFWWKDKSRAEFLFSVRGAPSSPPLRATAKR